MTDPTIAFYLGVALILLVGVALAAIARED